jgi:hypothetical protein
MDNTQVNTGTGDVVRDIDRTGQPGSQAAKTQVMQLDIGGQYAESLVNPFNPVPTSDINSSKAQSPDQPFFASIVGDPNGDFAGVPILEKLVDDSGELSMAVKVVNPPKQDARGALVLSDNPGPISLVLGPSGTFSAVIDCSGYTHIVAGANAGGGAGLPQFSNDGAVFANTYAFQPLNNSAATPSANFTAGNNWVIPIYAKYFRISSSAAGLVTLNLRAGPIPPSITSQNIHQMSGASVVNGGTAGSLGVGGILGNATTLAGAASPNPMLIAAADSGTPGVNFSAGAFQPTLRRLLSDNTGRLRLAEETGLQTLHNTPALNVQDTTQTDGQTDDEMIAQLLLETRITNQLLYDLPDRLYAVMQSLQQTSSQPFRSFAGDDPATLRGDPSIFN